ncbi:hypothetical protein V6Z11_A04G127100 [Gossypium hirsutum]
MRMVNLLKLRVKAKWWRVRQETLLVFLHQDL